MMLWIPTNPDGDSNPGGDPRFFFLGELSHKSDWESHESDSESHESDSELPKPASNGHSEAPTSISTDPSLSPIQAERETNGLSDPEFGEWLTRKASQLPQRPALLNQWIKSQAGKEANQREFAEWRQARERAKVTPVQPSPALTIQNNSYSSD